MNISLDLIEYYWDLKVYDKQKMCELVEDSIKSKDDFHYITRLEYDVIKEELDKKRRALVK